MRALPPWKIELRDWQQKAVGSWARSRPETELAVVTPGGGKSLYAAAIAYGAFASGLIDGVIVVVPSDHLRSQIASTFASVGIELDPYFANADKSYARDMRGIVVTIHQVALDSHLFASFVAKRRMLVVIDEIHHAGASKRWGTAIERAFANAHFLVGLSGTPFRTDRGGISFLSYDKAGRVEADVVYSYRDAVRDGIVRPLVFHRQGGAAVWTGANGVGYAHSFEDSLSKQRSSERLRAVLWDSVWVGEVLRRANAALVSLRRTDRDAAGLIVCIDEAHARFVARIMGEFVGVAPTVVVSADISAGAKIKRFTDGTDPWLLAVRMVSEGVDVPRFRVLAYLSNVRAELFFRQIAGRVVRARNGSTAPGYVFFPDDPVLRTFAQSIEADVRASRDVKRLGEHGLEEPSGEESGPRESLFASLEAVHHDMGTLIGETSATALPVGGEAPVHAHVHEAIGADRKVALRREVWQRVGKVSERFGRPQKMVYAYLAKRDGVGVTHATEAQLAARIRSLDTWLENGFCPL